MLKRERKGNEEHWTGEYHGIDVRAWVVLDAEDGRRFRWFLSCARENVTMTANYCSSTVDDAIRAVFQEIRRFGRMHCPVLRHRFLLLEFKPLTINSPTLSL
jgi:hypothetical protein